MIRILTIEELRALPRFEDIVTYLDNDCKGTCPLLIIKEYENCDAQYRDVINLWIADGESENGGDIAVAVFEDEAGTQFVLAVENDCPIPCLYEGDEFGIYDLDTRYILYSVNPLM